MNSSIVFSIFGILHVGALYHCRWVLQNVPNDIMLNEFQDLVSGLDGVMFNDLMENIEWFFNLHDKNKDGYLTKDEVLTLCESLLVCPHLLLS
jgi:hypothetical protein